MTDNLHTFFNPKSIAIIGASPDDQSLNGRTLKYLIDHQYQGTIYPVNPKYSEIRGLAVYPDIRSIPNSIDLAIFVVAAKRIPELLEQCIEKEIPYAIIYSSGFAESGDEGRRMQDYLSDIATSGKIRILGPNCQGMFNVINRVAASFSAALTFPDVKTGPVGFVSQSGALGYSTYNLLQEEGIGFSYVVSTGNEVDLEITDFLNYFANDNDTKVLVSYVEGFKKPEALFDLAENCLQREKPLLIYKVGSSEIGAKAASSHTAALAGSSILYDTLFEQLGIVKISDVEEISDLCKLLTFSKAPKGNRIGIITTSGGAGVALADQCFEYGLPVPPLSEETKTILSRYLPDYGSDLNPVDITAQVASSPEYFNETVKAVANDPNVDILVVALTMVTGSPAANFAQLLIETSEQIEKPLVIMWVAGDTLTRQGLALLREAQLPFFKGPQRCIKSISKFVNVYQNFERKTEILDFISNRQSHKRTELTISTDLNEYEAKKWLQQHGLPITNERIVNTAEEAAVAAESIGFPVALKVQSTLIPHKTEAGGVILNLNSKEEVVSAYHTIIQNVINSTGVTQIEGMLVQEMIHQGKEVIIGLHADPQLGPSIIFGLGGIFVETIRDVKIAIPPLSKSSALKLIKGIRSYPLLTGVRGEKGVDIDSLAELISKFSIISSQIKGNVQIDLNPVIVSTEGVKIVDAVVMVNK